MRIQCHSVSGRGRVGESRRLVLTACLGLLAPLVPAANAAEQRDTLERINQSYYNLKAEGLEEFRCRVVPDWDSVYRSVKADADGLQLRDVLDRVHFEVAVGPDGAASISRTFDTPPPSQQLAERIRIVTSGFEQVVVGFFQTWTQFVFSPVFPEKASVQLEKLDSGYRINQTQDTTRAVLLFTPDLMLKDVELNTPGNQARFHTRFDSRGNLYILTAFEATFDVGSDTPQATQIKSAAQVKYQEVQGFALPETVDVTVITSAITLQFPIRFSDCSVKKRSALTR
jgi:hypothetical protein